MLRLVKSEPKIEDDAALAIIGRMMVDSIVYEVERHETTTVEVHVDSSACPDDLLVPFIYTKVGRASVSVGRRIERRALVSLLELRGIEVEDGQR